MPKKEKDDFEQLAGLFAAELVDTRFIELRPILLADRNFNLADQIWDILIRDLKDLDEAVQKSKKTKD